ncbi:MAG: LacI family DNA-binding transcriptional regulator [Actinomycetes bacterium]
MGGATIYQIAQHAGVSIATVSRVAHGQSGVSEETRGRVQASMRDLGYVPNGAARGLATRRHGVIGLIFADLDDPSEESGHESLLYTDEIIRGAERAARAHGHAVLIAATHTAGSRDLLLSVVGKVDALVVLARSVPTAEIRQLTRIVPVALLAAERRIGAVDQVRVDNAAGMRDLTAHLINHHRYRDLAFIAGPSTSPDAAARFRAYRSVVGVVSDRMSEEPDVEGDFTEKGGREALHRLLERRRKPPRAIVVSNDQMAVGVISALAEQGYRVPTDVAVTGFDDIQLARVISPRLSTVHQPMRQLGQTCVQLLMARLADPERRPTSVVLPTQFVPRSSCGCREPRP